MGMFDSVFAPCPNCGKLLEFQSKEGECMLRRYKHTSVPSEIAVDLTHEDPDGKPYDLVNCCDTNFRLKATIARVSMQIEEWNEYEKGEWN